LGCILVRRDALPVIGNSKLEKGQEKDPLHVNTAYLVITLLFAAMAAFSGLGKIRRDPRIVYVINEVVGVPLKYFSLLAACELAGALGLVLGIWWPSMGVAASIGLVLYFVGATVSHLRVGDVKGIGPASFMLAVAAGALAMRILTLGTPR
jgi:hypothetical protein